MSAKRIIISRTDSIGDVILTLPMCVWLKDHFKDAELIYLGKAYTRPVVECFSVIDRFLDWEEISALPTAEKTTCFTELEADAIIHVFPNKEIASLAKKAKIPMRVGTSHRGFHLLSCNHRVGFSRKNSDLHEAQLNFELLRPLGLKQIPSLNEIVESLQAFKVVKTELPSELQVLLSNKSKNVVLHPKSQGSALEWPIASYIELAERLVEHGFTVFFTGTSAEGDLFREHLPSNEHIVDATGKLTLRELIWFISKVDVLVACSTGPLHISGFTGIKAVGLYSPKRPIHPGRWQALGKNVSILVNNPDCPTCKKGRSCECITNIAVDRVLREIV
jgi:ADP-heptose:LPS heptosyltransferase